MISGLFLGLIVWFVTSIPVAIVVGRFLAHASQEAQLMPQYQLIPVQEKSKVITFPGR
jgi:membrane protein required for beta-lactamase induction